MRDDDVLDIRRIELRKELLAETRDRRFYVRWGERSFGTRFPPGIVEILSLSRCSGGACHSESSAY
jgi:hypothetical protein